MSLSTEKLPDSILIGHVAHKNIYYVKPSEVPKNERVKFMEFDKDITSVPYINQKSNQRSASFISGISGSGKSTKAASLIKKIRRVRQDRHREIVVFSSGSIEDPVWEQFEEIEVIDMNDERFLEIQIEDLSGYIVVFDDWENVSNKELKKYIAHFAKDCLERTRKLECDIIFINHQTQNYNVTKGLIFECDTFYLNIAANRNASIKFLKSYSHLTKKELMELDSYEFSSEFGFVTFRKSYPSYIIVENSIQLL
jgi:ABC-type dipeptide/oligopeptide/nickel transport system ATPase component